MRIASILLTILTLAIVIQSCSKESLDHTNTNSIPEITIDENITFQHHSILNLNLESNTFEMYAEKYLEAKSISSSIDPSLSTDEIIDNIFTNNHPELENTYLILPK